MIYTMRNRGDIGRLLLGYIFHLIISLCFVILNSGYCDYLTRKEYVISTWTVNDGLPQNNIQAIIQDSIGYIWIGTEAGLARFDGNVFKVFDSNSTPIMKSNDIIALYLDTNGAIFISTYSGGILKFWQDKFSSLNQELGLDPEITGKLLRDSRGNLWIGTKAGLYRFSAGQLVRYTIADGLPNDIISCLLEDNIGTIWIGTYGGGLSSLKGGVFKNYSTKDGLESNTIRCMYFDNNRTLWIGTYGGGINCYKNGSFLPFSKGLNQSDNMIRAILEDRSGAIWIGTYGGGLKKFIDKNFLKPEQVKELPSKYIWVLFEDKERNLWIGTKGRGLIQLRPSKFMTYTMADGLPDDFVRSVFEDREKQLWIGTNRGLAKIFGNDIAVYQMRDGLINNYVRTIYQDKAGNIWVGTNGGLNKKSKGKWKSFTEQDGLSSNLINVLYENQQGNLLVGTYGGGIDIIKDGVIRQSSLGSQLPNKIVFDLCETSDGRLWVGTQKGLACFYQGNAIDFTGRTSFMQDTVLDIYEDREGTLWIGTYGNGIKRIRNGQVSSFTTEHGLYNDYIYCILEDSKSNFWISSKQGIFSLPKISFDNLNIDNISVLDVTNYDTSDGLLSNECNGMVQPAAWKTVDGHLFFATVKGLVHVDPTHIDKNPLPPPVIIEEITIDGKPLSNMSNTFSIPRVKNLMIRFTALSFASPKKMKFSYKLDNFDKNWNIPKNPRLRTASYSNLSPGNYKFTVKASNNDGVWNENGASIEFRCKQYPYQNPALLIISFVCLVGIGFLYKRYFLIGNRKKRNGKYENSSLSESEAEDIANRLVQFMESSRIYTDPELTVDKLASFMHVSRKYLSQVLSEHFNQNFNNFVNSYRIKEAKKLILDPQNHHLKLLAIAYDVGFSSKSVFNQAFKKHAGCTPSQLLRNKSEQKSKKNN